MKVSEAANRARGDSIERLEADLRISRHAEQDARRQASVWMEKAIEADRRLDHALAIRKHEGVRQVEIKARAGVSQSTAFIIGSDWHVEETIDPSTVGDANSYNLGIAEKRIDAFFQNGYRLVEIQRAGTDIDDLVLGLLGDHMTGYIHEELQESNGLSPTQTILWLKPRIIGGIRALAKNFKRVTVVCTIGNHGRTTLKKRVSTSYKNSFEWMMYHDLAEKFDGTNVRFEITNGYHAWVKCYDYPIRFHHGDSIRYKDGIGGLTIPAMKKIAKWNTERAAYLDVFGHWHQYFDGGKFISNGCLIGYSPFAVMIGAPYEPPSQAFFLINRDRGKTIVAPIWPDKPNASGRA